MVQQIHLIGKIHRLSDIAFSIFAVASVPMVKLYYQEFQRQMAADPAKQLRVAVIYSYGANEEVADGLLDEENPDTSALDGSLKKARKSAIV